jgi:Fur family transcriptional regulator, ferric uptake regulator
MAATTPLIAALENAGYRLTGPRRMLVELIADREGSTFTAADLVSDVRARQLGIGRATVFRSIDLLEAVGAVERIDLQTGEHAYVACVPAHHHHVVCSRCARAAEIGDLGLGAVAREVARRTGYRVDEHRLELFGLCPACQLAVARA